MGGLATSSTAAVVLCGGRSARMGQDKASLEFQGRSLLQRTIDAIPSACQPIVVAAAAHQILPHVVQPITLVRDNIADLGPFEGLRAALNMVPSSTELILLLPCDHPLMRAEFLGWMIEQLPETGDAAVPRIGENRYPLPAVYRANSLRNAIHLAEASRRRSLNSLLDQLKVHELPEAMIVKIDPQCWSLRNVNSPADYQQLIRESEDRC